MTGPVLLNNVDHHDLRVATARGSRWGDAVNQALVFPTEFEALSREYTIIFRRGDEQAFRATVLLGFAAGENLFLDGERWAARYLPAVMARGPFSIGAPPEGQPGEPMIHVDPDHPRVSRNEGARVFLDHGGNAPYLEQVAGVLRAIHAGTQAAGPMYAAWAALDLFDPVALEIESAGGRRFAVPDVWTLHPGRFAQLKGEVLERLNRDDQLQPAVWAMSSLGNLPRLVELKEQRDGGG